jgi:phosphatidylserine/phosphatidylglycerophosphate/cardiolipin synthase-like enzyme
MPKFLTTSGIACEIEQILLTAQRNVLLLSPYLKISKILLDRVRDASRQGVKVFIVYGKKDLDNKEIMLLKQIKTLRLYYLDNLHAKCYLNEHSMIVTSMNLHEFSEKNNREMGILINKKDDYDLFISSYKEVLSIINSSSFKNLNQLSDKILSLKAFCIRCHSKIEYDISYPFCDICYSSWAKYKNFKYRESYCHHCGESYATTFISPQCPSCVK